MNIYLTFTLSGNYFDIMHANINHTSAILQAAVKQDFSTIYYSDLKFLWYNNMATTGWILLLIAACSLHLAAARAKSGVLFSNPCWGKPCHTYAKCEVINGTQAVCVCPQNCTSVRKPVCGTNWKTYDNLCTLMAESCSMNDWNSLRYNGECKAGDCLNSIWQIANCPFHSKCRLHYGLPRCVCLTEKCPTNYEPLCATDGRTYRNACHLRKGGCNRKKLLRVRNPGHCKPDPCEFHECCCGASCRVNATNYPMCSCNFTCSQSSSRVCGSDGKTYNSPCDLRMASCMEQNMKLTQVSNGACFDQNVTPSPRTTNPCLSQICSHHATCIVEQGLPKCICPVCPTTRSPVCGSNGVTYQNECFLNRASCVSMTTITMARMGSCGSVVGPTASTNDLCSLGECAHYSRCMVVRGVPKCVCPDLCPQVNAPVCGSDGVTYENDCAMRRASCKSEKTLIAHSRGPCEQKPTAEPTKPTMDPCFGQSCTYHAECVVDRGLPKCVCPSNCPNASTPICGSDGVTYDNECLMKRASCIKQLTITIASAERCGPRPTLPPTENPCAMGMCAHYARCVVVQGRPRCVCPDLCPNIFSPQCGSDGQTYQNECSLKRKSCDKQTVISVAKEGPCDTPPTEAPTQAAARCGTMKCEHFSSCEVVQGVAKCVCPSLCPGVRLAVCGSDGNTYDNECALRRTSCLAGRLISIVRIGVCLRTQAPITQATTTPSAVLPSVKPANNPCAGGTCVNYAICEVFQGQPRCICPSPCTGAKSPVCGSDGRSYDSECELKRSSCTSQKTITVAKPGFCEPVGRCPNPQLCSNQCSQTNDICSLNGKMCCCLGCGLSCTTPVWSMAMRQYLCPADPLGCRNDGDCSGGMICCDTGCTKRCIAPRL